MSCVRLAVLTAVLAVACGGKGANTPGRDYPPYTGRTVELFDDGIDPIAVGYQLEPGPPPAMDSSLRERVQTADAVLRARVVTVTSRDEDSKRSWQLGLHTLTVLAGSSPPDTDFQLEVESTDPGAGMVRAFEGRLVSATFVVALRTFARPGDPGASDPHFHLLADKPDVLAAIKEASLLQQVR